MIPAPFSIFDLLLQMVTCLMDSTGQELAPTSVRNSSARLSALLGIVSFLGGVIFTSIPAIILGHMALQQIRSSKGVQHGEDLAIVGLVLGYVATAGFVLVVGGILIRYWDIVVYLWKLTYG